MLPLQANLQLRVLPQPHQCQRVLVELLAGGRERGAIACAFEQRATDSPLDDLDAGAHRRLRDIHLAGCLDETASLGDHQEGACKCDVHRLPVHCEMGAEMYLSKSSIDVSGKIRL